MAVYAVGDVQGCCDELRRLLDTIRFDPVTDRLWLAGDLVNRGPASLQTLRLVRDMGEAAIAVLGNHDLHLLALALAGDASRRHEKDPGLMEVLAAADGDELIDWLRQRPLIHYEKPLNTLMVHAGVAVEWDRETALELAGEVEAMLRGDNPAAFLQQMYGTQPDRWSPRLHGMNRLRFIVNSCTRMRYYRTDGSLDFDAKLAPEHYPAQNGSQLIPWFRHTERRARDTRIVFGHWSALGYVDEANVLGLDTGCVWGGPLTAARLDSPAPLVQISSSQPKQF